MIASSVAKSVARSVASSTAGIASGEAAQPDAVTTTSSVGGFYVSQLAGDSNVNASTGRVWVLTGMPIIAACDLTAIRVRTVTATSCKLSIWRSGTRVWQSDLITGLTANAVNVVPVGVSVLVGDVIGLWMPSGAGTFAYRTMTTVTTVFAEDATNTVTSTSGMGSDAGAICVEALATASMLAVTGDSILEGHNGWHGPMHPAEIQGGNVLNQPGYIAAKTKGWGYQNHALGSQTYVWVLATGAPSAFNSGATHVWINCGGNDLVTGRTWAQVEADLDAILALKPATTKLYLSEILPAAVYTDSDAALMRTWNANLATWCSANRVNIIRGHDALAKIRTATGELDDLATGYDDGSGHLTLTGANQYASIFAPVAIEFSSAPTISGVPNVGSILTVISGSLTGSTPITSVYQWIADGVDISGGTGTTYTLAEAQLGKTITCRQTATNSAGSVSSTSSGVGPVDPASTLVTVDFDGSTGYVTGTPLNVFNTGTSFTIAVAIDANSTSSGCIFSMGHMLCYYYGGRLAFGNTSGFRTFPVGNGSWRFIYDVTATGLARFRAFNSSTEQTGVDEFSFLAMTPTGALEFGRRNNNTLYFDGRLSAVKAWSRICLPSDSDQATDLTLSLATITTTTWDDVSSNNTDYTLTGGAQQRFNMATDKIKANDTRQQLTATLELDGTAVNLTGCTILCLLKLNESPFTAYSIASSIVSAAAGTVKCLASTSGFPTVAGTYKQEWQVTFGDATVLTFPSNSYNELKILDDLN